MEQELIYGTYFFFLLIGTGLGLTIGYFVGFVTGMRQYDYDFSFLDLDEDDYAHEESLCPDNSQFSILNSQLPPLEVSE